MASHTRNDDDGGYNNDSGAGAMTIVGEKRRKKLVDETCEKTYIIDTNLYLFLLL